MIDEVKPPTMRVLVLAVVSTAGALADAVRGEKLLRRDLPYEEKERLTMNVAEAVEAMRDYAMSEAVRVALEQPPQ